MDITLVDADGNELEMGTDYYDFSEKAHADYENISNEPKPNRKLLTEIMTSIGFDPFETEWRHFDFKGWKKFAALDVIIN